MKKTYRNIGFFCLNNIFINKIKMRRFDKKTNIQKANLLAEQRYLTSKGVINEEPIGGYTGDIGFVPGKKELNLIKQEVEDLNPNFTIDFTALKVMPLNLEITYNLDDKTYDVINSNNGKYYANNITYRQCVDCKFNSPDDVIKFIRLKAEGGDIKYMP